MKSILFSPFILLASFSSFSQKAIEATSQIKSVTVYLSGAELLMQSNVSVPAGNSEIIFGDLPVNVNPGTVQVSANTDLTILSAVFRLNYLNTKKENTQVKALRDSLDLLTNQLKKIQGQKAIVKGQMDLLNANKDVSGQNTGLNMDQLMKMYEYYGTKMKELNEQMIELEIKEKMLNEGIQRLNNQLNEVNSKFSQPTGEILVSVSSKTTKNATFQLTYLMYDAGWSPMYDVRSKDTKSKVTLNYKANVWQRSGMDWNDVSVKLSTGNPTISATGPLLTPWYLNFYSEIFTGGIPAKYGDGRNLSNQSMQKSEEAPAIAEDQYESASSSGANYTTVTQTQLNAEFEISIPYDIPSDGKEHLIAIQDYELPAFYHYYAAPKLDQDAFLTADISNWEELNLLPGTMNIFFEGSYVGQAYLNPTTTRDTLPISLGRDKNIIIKREKVKDFSKEKTIGDSKKQSFAYTISIKNTKKEAIDIKVLDQYPISQQGKIEVTLDDAGGATIQEGTGKLIWNLRLEPNGETKLQFSFTVKYPKDQVIGGL